MPIIKNLARPSRHEATCVDTCSENSQADIYSSTIPAVSCDSNATAATNEENSSAVSCDSNVPAATNEENSSAVSCDSNATAATNEENSSAVSCDSNATAATNEENSSAVSCDSNMEADTSSSIPTADICDSGNLVLACNEEADKINLPGRIIEALNLLHEGDIVRITIPGDKTSKTKVGYYTDFTIIPQVIEEFIGKKNIFFSLQPIADARKVESQINETRYLYDSPPVQCLGKGAVERYKYLFIDVDPLRAVGHEHDSATDEESQNAYAFALSVKKVCMKRGGFPEPIFACSGNGYHLLFKVDAPADEDTRKLFKELLRMLSHFEEGSGAVIDTTVCDAARLCKLYGTPACKGTGTEERPYRDSYIISYPEEPVNGKDEVLTLDKIKKFIDFLNDNLPLSKINHKKKSKDDDNEYLPHKVAKSILIGHDVFMGSNNRQPYVVLKDAGENRIFSLNDKELSYYFISQYYQQTGNFAGELSFEAILQTLIAEATQSPNRKEVCSRIGQVNELQRFGNDDSDYQYVIPSIKEIYYALWDEEKRIVKITASDIEFVKDSPLAFINSGGSMGEQTGMRGKTKVSRADVKRSLPDLIYPYFNVATQEEKLLLLAAIISWFFPDVSKPIIMITGVQGSGKTFLSRLIKTIVDPSIDGLPTMPSMETLMLLVNTKYVVALDNLSFVNNNISDVLCNVATGGSYAKRTLYTTSSLTTLNFKNCVLLNGISDPTSKPDVLDRTLPVTLLPLNKPGKKGSIVSIPKRRRDEMAFDAAFKNDLPAIMDGIFLLLQDILAILSNTRVNSTGNRMTEFERIGAAVSQILFNDPNIFVKAYSALVSKNCWSQVEDCPTTNAVMIYVAKHVTTTKRISAYDFWCRLNHIATEAGIPTSDGKMWPRSAAALKQKLDKYIPGLQEAGVEIIHTRDNKGSWWQITRTDKFKFEEPLHLMDEPIMKLNHGKIRSIYSKSDKDDFNEDEVFPDDVDAEDKRETKVEVSSQEAGMAFLESLAE